MTPNAPVLYTRTDEAPALATYSLLPIIRRFLATAGVDVEARDISLAGRILAQFPDRLPEDRRVSDDLAELGRLAKTPEANIIKLPNISASMPQLQEAIGELQAAGFELPDYPHEPSTDEERRVKQKYDSVKGSAVNPVLREGNSDRRAPRAVKEYARKHPHSMGAWSKDSKTHVATMQSGDFRANEKSVTVASPTKARIELVTRNGAVTVLKDDLALEAGEVIDGTFMSKQALVTFLTEQVAEAKRQGVLFSLHMKATMMKVSDPIIFGHAVRVYFKDLFDQHGSALGELGVEENHGVGDLESKLEKLPADRRQTLEAELQAAYSKGPALAMVNSDRGITNLHVPSDVIIDASMPAMIRSSGKMWNAKGELEDTKAVIPDSSYAGIYQATIDFCKQHGAFDPTTMGSVANVGLMAQKAEEYGSHDKTFELDTSGTVRVVTEGGKVLMEHEVEQGDIWRMCRTKDAAVSDWVKLAVTRARATGAPTLFWLDADRPHDAQLVEKVNIALKQHDTSGLDLQILSPVKATEATLQKVKQGKDVISVTGNVLRDYLTDLFPILELGTSAKMLSIVPLMQGGGLFETGAGGSAPKHVEQFVEEGHLRWDSLGEFLALAVSLDHLAQGSSDASNRTLLESLASTLDEATTQYLLNGKSPSRKVGELDNRGSHFYLALYWAQALAEQSKAPELASRFAGLAKALAADEQKIVGELNAAQGSPVDLGGYYLMDEKLASLAMRPSSTFNAHLESL